MEFIDVKVNLVPMFKTREEVAAVRKSLEKATEEPFQRLELAKIRSWQDASEIVLD
jgi:hypothetical protein